MSFKEHIYRLYLDRKLYLATIQLQAEKGLGKSFSAMLPFVEGLHSMGYLNDLDYELYKRKYSVGLKEAANIPTAVEIIRQEKKENVNKSRNRYYQNVLSQWDYMTEKKPKTLVKYIAEAKHYQNLKYARALLEKAKKENGGLEVG